VVVFFEIRADGGRTAWIGRHGQLRGVWLFAWKVWSALEGSGGDDDDFRDLVGVERRCQDSEDASGPQRAVTHRSLHGHCCFSLIYFILFGHIIFLSCLFFSFLCTTILACKFVRTLGDS
jgi:hypothetical protein